MQTKRQASSDRAKFSPILFCCIFFSPLNLFCFWQDATAHFTTDNSLQNPHCFLREINIPVSFLHNIMGKCLEDGKGKYSVWRVRCFRLTDNLFVREAHDAHGVECLLEIVLVLLSGDGNVTVWQETVAVKSFKKQVRWRKTETI